MEWTNAIGYRCLLLPKPNKIPVRRHKLSKCPEHRLVLVDENRMEIRMYNLDNQVPFSELDVLTPPTLDELKSMEYHMLILWKTMWPNCLIESWTEEVS